ncbi:hypothetical protein HMPREF9333_02170 [Johnsonella ignava ATCC 51276]|uniref:Uncharacterized protein n=1 Tax=Johnsonella ignava ATCC 51276 TaxID=679200 RepID=G5GKS5_9FIRM|nr:hypothetical protein HMPREF9333_02170 [Johnsonella ignava ATCC 51276]
MLPPAKQVSNKNAAMLLNKSITQADQNVNSDNLTYNDALFIMRFSKFKEL